MSQKQRFLDEALKEAKDIARRQDLNDEERTDLQKRVERIERMKAEIKQDAAIEEALKDLPEAESEDVAQGPPRGAKGLGASFVASEQFEQAKAMGFRGTSAPYEYKGEPTVVDETTAVPALVVAQRVNQMEGLASYPATVADLIPTIPTGSNAVTYFTETSETNAIDTVAEGAEKPNFTLAGAAVTDEVEVIAGMAAVTRQTLEDAPFMAGFINTRLTKALRIVEENQILEGDGTSPNLNSLDNRTTSTLSQGTDTVLDAIYKAADKCYTAGGYPADGVAINPADWQPIALSKDGNDRYYGTGPFASAVGDSVWGLRVVKSNVLTAGKVFVGAFGSAAFLARNGGLTLRTSDSHSTYFKFNKVAILIEERVALGVPAPLAFCQLTLA
jgi:HK97 family phage major capsid protein